MHRSTMTNYNQFSRGPGSSYDDADSWRGGNTDFSDYNPNSNTVTASVSDVHVNDDPNWEQCTTCSGWVEWTWNRNFGRWESFSHGQWHSDASGEGQYTATQCSNCGSGMAKKGNFNGPGGSASGGGAGNQGQMENRNQYNGPPERQGPGGNYNGGNSNYRLALNTGSSNNRPGPGPDYGPGSGSDPNPNYNRFTPFFRGNNVGNYEAQHQHQDQWQRGMPMGKGGSSRERDRDNNFGLKWGRNGGGDSRQRRQNQNNNFGSQLQDARGMGGNNNANSNGNQTNQHQNQALQKRNNNANTTTQNGANKFNNPKSPLKVQVDVRVVDGPGPGKLNGNNNNDMASPKPTPSSAKTAEGVVEMALTTLDAGVWLHNLPTRLSRDEIGLMTNLLNIDVIAQGVRLRRKYMTRVFDRRPFFAKVTWTAALKDNKPNSTTTSPTVPGGAPSSSPHKPSRPAQGSNGRDRVLQTVSTVTTETFALVNNGPKLALILFGPGTGLLCAPSCVLVQGGVPVFANALGTNEAQELSRAGNKRVQAALDNLCGLHRGEIDFRRRVRFQLTLEEMQTPTSSKNSTSPNGPNESLSGSPNPATASLDALQQTRQKDKIFTFLRDWLANRGSRMTTLVIAGHQQSVADSDEGHVVERKIRISDLAAKVRMTKAQGQAPNIAHPSTYGQAGTGQGFGNMGGSNGSNANWDPNLNIHHVTEYGNYGGETNGNQQKRQHAIMNTLNHLKSLGMQEVVEEPGSSYGAGSSTVSNYHSPNNPGGDGNGAGDDGTLILSLSGKKFDSTQTSDATDPSGGGAGEPRTSTGSNNMGSSMSSDSNYVDFRDSNGEGSESLANGPNAPDALGSAVNSDTNSNSAPKGSDQGPGQYSVFRMNSNSFWRIVSLDPAKYEILCDEVIPKRIAWKRLPPVSTQPSAPQVHGGVGSSMNVNHRGGLGGVGGNSNQNVIVSQPQPLNTTASTTQGPVANVTVPSPAPFGPADLPQNLHAALLQPGLTNEASAKLISDMLALASLPALAPTPAGSQYQSPQNKNQTQSQNLNLNLNQHQTPVTPTPRKPQKLNSNPTVTGTDGNKNSAALSNGDAEDPGTTLSRLHRSYSEGDLVLRLDGSETQNGQGDETSPTTDARRSENTDVDAQSCGGWVME